MFRNTGWVLTTAKYRKLGVDSSVMTGAVKGLVGERRVITALFCDVVGSTSMAEGMDPEDWGELVTGLIGTMTAAVDRYGGTVTEFGGDAVVAVFGAPMAHEDDPYRAVKAATEIVESINSMGEGHKFEVRAGVHTGLAVAGDISTRGLQTFSALGDTVNVAARLQSVAQPGTVVISADTRRLLGRNVEVTSLGPTSLKGRVDTVEAFSVDAIEEPENRRRGLPGLTSDLVGRDQEVNLVLSRATLAGAGTGRVLAVLGEPGVGKSRLMSEVAFRLAASGSGIWAEGKSVPFDSHIPYHLVASLVRSLGGVTAADSHEVVSDALSKLLHGLEAESELGVLSRLLGLPGDYGEVTPDELLATYRQAVSNLIVRAAKAEPPLVLVCEDAHWADPSSVELLIQIAEVVPTVPVLLVLVMRPETESDGWALLETCRRELPESLTEIPLSPLDDVGSRELISNLLEIESLPLDWRRLVLDKAEGNPFFLEEVVRMLIERDLVESDRGRWVAKGDLANVEVPETIHGLLASRIDLLPPDVRRSGRIAAVLGRTFSSALFAKVADPDASDHQSTLHPHVARLEAVGMVRLEDIEPDLVFGFRHALIHDVMYEGLLKRERREIHGRVAEAIIELAGDDLEGSAAELAAHLYEAGDYSRAARFSVIAGRKAMAQGARVESEAFFASAQRAYDEDPDADPTAYIDAVLGRVHAGTAFIPGDKALNWISGAIELASQIDDPIRLAHLYERSIFTRSMQGETFASEEFRKELNAAHDLAQGIEDDETIGLIEAAVGSGHRSVDEYEAALEPLGRAVESLSRSGRNAVASFNASMLADAFAQLGRFDEAAEAIDLATELAEASRDPNAKLDADLIRGGIAGVRGDLSEAMEYTKKGVDGAEAVGNTFCDLAGSFWLADQHLRLGEVDTAIEHLEKSTGLAQYCNAGGYEALGAAWLASARARAGDLRPEDFEAPLEAAVSASSRSTEGHVRLKRAVAYADSGLHEEAEDDFERAIELFESYGGLPNLARARHAYAESLTAAGDSTRAKGQFEAASALFDQLGIIPDTATVS